MWGEPVNYSFRERVPKEEIPNTTYLTHGIYGYPAKFIPHVPHFVMRRFLDEPNQLVFDPFAGSGTTAVEALKLGHNCIVADINPILDVLARAKTTRLTFQLAPSREGQKRKADPDISIPSSAVVTNAGKMIVDPHAIVEEIRHATRPYLPEWKNIDHWVEPEFKDVLARVWGYIHHEGTTLDDDLRSVVVMAALYVTKHYSNGALDVPKLYKSKRRIREIGALKEKFARDPARPYRLLEKKVRDYYQDVRAFSARLSAADLTVRFHDQGTLAALDPRTLGPRERFVLSLGGVDSINYKVPPRFRHAVDLLVTSPPYVYAQEYIRSSKLDMYWLGLVDDARARALAKTEIGHRKPADVAPLLAHLTQFPAFRETLARLHAVERERYGKTGKYTEQIIRYFADMYQIMENAREWLRPGGIFAFFVGNPTTLGVQLPCHALFMDFLDDAGYRIVEYGYDPIVSRALLRKRKNASPDGMEYEWLIVAEN